MVKAFPTATNADEHGLLALVSERTGREDVDISRGQFACSRRFIRLKPREISVQQMLYSLL